MLLNVLMKVAACRSPHLEKVVLEEVPHGLVRRDVPPCVEVKVEGVEPEDKHECRELGLEANRYQNHQQTTYHVLDELKTNKKEVGTHVHYKIWWQK